MSTNSSPANASQRYLWTEIATLHASLRARLSSQSGAGQAPSPVANALDAPTSAVSDSGVAGSALNGLCRALELSAFERYILLMAVALELDPDFAQTCASLNGDPARRWPTFQLALAARPDGEWEALTPVAALRHWRLVEVLPGDTLLTSPLRIDERILHYLMGAPHVDLRLQLFVSPLTPPQNLPASYSDHAERIIASWTQKEQTAPLVELCGPVRGDKQQLAAAVCQALGLRLFLLRTSDLPHAAVERETLARLWHRESLLLRSALFLEARDDEDAAGLRTARSFVESCGGFCLANRRLSESADADTLQLELSLPSQPEQLGLWRSALGPTAATLNGQLDQISSQFRLDAGEIQQVARRLFHGVPRDTQPHDTGRRLWAICRQRGRASLERLASRVEIQAKWPDLILPDEQLATLREMVAQVRQRRTVYETWDFASWGKRGAGTTALFAGPSGTGKTLAAEVVASELGLDLYLIDLSQIVSKFIGETEKNLRRVFDAADDSSAVLLFDEADALFGKRSEVKDSHDRYANIEVSYLLQRMEAYRGLAILTTNRRSSLDGAFLRRIRFALSFAFPDQPHRRRIWERAFPPAAPVAGLDLDRLARLTLAGGNIRNIALNAAFLAADAGEPIGMQHLLRTARSEYAKLDKPMTSAELGGWP